MPGKRRGTCTVDGTALANKRELAGLTCADLAAKITCFDRPVDRSLIYRAEKRGRTSPALRKAIADALGIDVKEIAGPPRPPAASTSAASA